MEEPENIDTLAEVFDTFPVANVPIENKQYNLVSAEDEKEADIQHVRSNLYSLIDKGTVAVDNALKVANEMQHPRAYEVAGNLIKNVADLTDKLVTLQKAKADLNPDNNNSKNVNIEKAVFVGSTAELLKNIKKHEHDND
jgi:TRAP-type uncharacterized transport system substrate-binding protein